jgi:hypothetical protein
MVQSWRQPPKPILALTCGLALCLGAAGPVLVTIATTLRRPATGEWPMSTKQKRVGMKRFVASAVIATFVAVF